MSASVWLFTSAPRWWSGAHRIFFPCSCRCRTTSSAIAEVTTQSARALTAALVFAYTTTVRSPCSSQKAENSPAGQPRSSEQVASRSGISTRFSGFRILAVSPMKRTPAPTLVVAGVRFMGETAKARHLQRIGDAASGFLGEVLKVGLDVVMRKQRRAPLLEQALDARF